MYYKEERLKKILAWKIISVSATTLLTWAHIGSIINAAYFALVLHIFLTFLYYVFSFIWDKKGEDA